MSEYVSPVCPQNMVNLGPLTAEIGSGVCGTPANFNGFRVLAALLHGTLVVGISQTLRRWTEGATYIRQGDHHVGHWPTFQYYFCSECTVNKHAISRTIVNDLVSVRYGKIKSFNLISFLFVSNAVNDIDELWWQISCEWWSERDEIWQLDRGGQISLIY